jgi:hypothetical protein
LIKPGKVSRDFINGKRSRYSNPFQFYLTVSIIFFIILGITDKYQEFNDFRNGTTEKGFSINDQIKQIEQNPDSIIEAAKKSVTGQLNDLDSLEKANVLNVLDGLKKETPDTTEKDTTAQGRINTDGPVINFGFGREDGSTVSKMVTYQSEHPDVAMDKALENLGFEKSFWNRFLYVRAKKLNSFITNTSEENKKLTKELISYASVSIFIFLPIFTLFLRFVYIRRKYTYVEHLIFVFHTQTVFFIMLTIFFLIGLFAGYESIYWVFPLLFLIYLLIAMKKFYQQGYFKTFIKFCFLNFVFVILGAIGFAILSMLTFAFY